MHSDEKTKDKRPSFFDSDRDIPNLILMFGVIAIIVQVYLGWDGFLQAWSGVGYYAEWLAERGYELDASDMAANSAAYESDLVRKEAIEPLFFGWQIVIGFQVAVLVFIKHYSNAIKRLKAQRAN
jgi:hypothetical protein